MQTKSLKEFLRTYFSAIDGRPNTKGGHFRINLLPTTCHVYFGSVTGATPTAVWPKEPTSEGISPVQGADLHGPTSVIKSAAKIRSSQDRRNIVKSEIHPASFLDSDTGIAKSSFTYQNIFQTRRPFISNSM